MKHVLTGCAGCSILMLALSGCGPELAQTQLGAEEEQWQTQIKSSYSSWKAPRSAPPATYDNRDNSLNAGAPAAADNAVIVDPKDTADKPAPDTVGIPGENASAAPAPAQDAPAKAEAAPAPDAAAAEAEVYTVQKGDTISKIAQKFYGDGRRYMPIVKANEALLKGNANRIYPGMKLSIPKR